MTDYNKKENKTQTWLKDKVQSFQLKREKRRERRMKRIEKRASYLSNHPTAKRFWLGLKLTIIGGIVIFFGYMTMITLNLINSYHDSVKWTKITGPALADQDTELLYDNAKNKELKLELTALMNDVWDFEAHLFKNEVSADQIKKMKELYQQVSEPKENLTKKYNEIMTFWDAKEQLVSIFTNEKFDTIKKDTTIQQISDVVDVVFDKIDDYLIKGDQYKQANIYKDIVYALSNDANTYASVLEQFNKLYTFTKDKNQTIIKTDMGTKEFDNLKSTMNMLSYQYDLITNFVSPIVNKSQDVVNKNAKNKNDFAIYQNDLNLKNKFQSYVEQYKATVNDLKTNVVVYENFEGHDIEELQNWAREHDLVLKIKEQNSDKTTGTVLTQSPSHATYDKIVKGSTIDVTIARKIVPQSSSSSSYRRSSSTTSGSSSSSSSSSSYSSNYNSSNR